MQTSQFRRENDRLATVIEMLTLPEADRLALAAEYRVRSEAAFAPATKRVLRQVVASFQEWCREQGHPEEPPISPSVVAAYVDSLSGRIRASTIETRLWAIAEMHKSRFLPSPCQHELVKLAIKAVKRQHGSATRQAAPLGKREIRRALQRLGNSRRDLRDRALLLVASDTWCRSAELVAFRVRDVLPQADGSGLLFIARSKTDTDGRGAYAYLSPQGLAAARQWAEVAGLAGDDPLFTSSIPRDPKRPLDPATVSRIFKQRTGRRDVSAHSTRVGGVHDALQVGCDLASIMIAGRWTSAEMPAQYGRMVLPALGAAAQVCAAWGE
ncbi:Integrase-like protein [Rubellimicrobium mesophilum DSM 19309]|uniref:Integrase-like protein n=1 Tax=Rubellimicrobium mesophilum DSM 19309 TaxID=442562 RepID=A0A017HI56_9RHOB|nr:tyrosine-type recombinase/integrase [Rubellimicrobium mesophilum]EYD73848.1 Integrase-like protein [Rubellimicrobium mesophilum DSM 19309]